MSCEYCSNLDRYNLLPREPVITNPAGIWDKDQNGPKPAMGHKSKSPIAAQPNFFVRCQEPER